ncbi:MAG: hypothetical protein FJX72_13650 [Armatimonadetes bacterium]|nr:hypothetical protein [Armatimonadota bacterium]
MKTDTLTKAMLCVIAALLAANLAVTLIGRFSTPAMAQAPAPRVVGITMDQKYLYRAWSNGDVEAVYCRWVGEQDPATQPNKWYPATPKNLK